MFANQIINLMSLVALKDGCISVITSTDHFKYLMPKLKIEYLSIWIRSQ